MIYDYFKDVTTNMKEMNDRIVDQLLEESEGKENQIKPQSSSDSIEAEKLEGDLFEDYLEKMQNLNLIYKFL